MNIKLKIITLFIGFLLHFSSTSAQKADSLRSLGLDDDSIIDWLQNKTQEPNLDELTLFKISSELGDLLSKNKEHLKAISVLKKNMQLASSLKLVNSLEFLDILNDLAYNLIQNSQVKTAEKYIRAHIVNEIKDWRYVKLCFYYSECLESLGDINLAQLHLERALRISEEIQNERYIARSLARLSRIYLLTTNINKAILLESSLTKYGYLDRMDQIMVVKFNIAGTFQNGKKYLKAIDLYDEIIAWGIKNHENEFIAIGNINRASCYRELKIYDKAIEGFRNAIRVDSSQEIVYQNFAEVFLMLGNQDSAIFYCELALEKAKIDLNNYDFNDAYVKHLFSYPKKEFFLLIFHDLARYLNAKAIFQNDDKSLLKAMSVFDLLDKLITEIRFSTTEQQSQHFWRNEVKPIYDNAILTAYLSFDIEKAFYFAEKSKAILLLDDLLINTTISKGLVPDELLEKEFILKQELIKTELKFNVNLSKAQQDSIKDILLVKKLALTDLLQEIATVAPQYVTAKYDQPISKLKEVQSKLAKGETIVNFIWAEDHIFRFVINNKTSTITKIKLQDDFELALNGLIQNFKKPASKLGTFIENNSVSNKIYTILLGDIEIQENKITILPDGLLNYLPFEALVVNDDYKNPAYLIESKIVSYGFSVNTMFVPYSKHKNKQIIAFAPLQYLPEMGLSELSFSEYELEPIVKSGAIVFEHKNASKQNILGNFEKSNVIHIYSHAEANDPNHPYPWIAAQNEFIFLPEIYNYKNNADLVVLSACETNLGKEVKGEGVISLARGFFHSGSKSVMASLWKVNDKSNSEIVHDFYQNVKKGKSKAEALRLSKLAYIKNHSIESRSPYYWAGLVYIGKDGVLNLNSHQNTNKKIFIGIGLSLILGLFMLYKFRFK